MSANMIKIIRTTFFALGLFMAGMSFAYAGWHGGGHHGGWHGWHGGGWHGGGWHGNGWGGFGLGVGTGLLIGAPLLYNNYYDNYYYPSCQTVRVCNRYGHCWLQESCY